MRLQGFRGNCSFRGKLGMCPSLAEPDSGGFSKSTVSHETKQKLLLEKPIFRIRQKGVPPLLLPASVLQLPRCLVRICNLLHKNNQIANKTVLQNAIAAGKIDCKNNLLRKCGLLAHTSAAFLKNCCTEKLFISPTACRRKKVVCFT